MNEDQDLEVVKWYTRARKFPQLIGRTPSGGRIWGGPYTVTQAVAAGTMLFIGANTMSVWGGGGVITNAVVLIACTYGVVLGIGRLPLGSRSPLSVGAGAYRALTSPQHGRLGGKAVRIRRPRCIHHRVTVITATTDPASTPAPAPAPVPAPAPAPAAPVGAPVRTAPADVTTRPPAAQAEPTDTRAPAGAAQPRRAALSGIQTLLAASTPAPTPACTPVPTPAPPTRSESTS